MKKFILSYVAPIIEVAATFGLAVTTVFVGTWASSLKLTKGQEFSELLEASKMHCWDWSSPVPYFIATLLISLAGRVEGFWNRYQRGNLEAKVSEIHSLTKNLRAEAQDHSQSKASYMETLESALRYCLTSAETGFNHNCRVTIYKRQDGSEGTLRQIFRHSEQHAYTRNGRIGVPVGEGVVGAAWNNHGEMEVSIDHDPSTEIFRTKMSAELAKHNCEAPTGKLSMPSRHFFAMKLEGHDRRERVGIVVYECTKVEALKAVGIKKAITEDMLNVSRMVKHLGVLRSEFQPAPRKE